MNYTTLHTALACELVFVMCIFLLLFLGDFPSMTTTHAVMLLKRVESTPYYHQAFRMQLQ